ncbi:MAG: AmmeMemoRadiSam system protein B [Phycisphaerales bacterium]
MTDQPAQPSQPVFDPSANHQQSPSIRRVRGVPLPVKGPDGNQAVMLGLTDAQQISPKMVVTHPAFQQVIGQMDGSRTIDEIVSQVGNGLERPMLENLIAQLDEAGFLYGPVFDGMITKMHADFDNADLLPPGSTAQFADMLVMQEMGEDATEEQKIAEGPAKLREIMDKWIDASLKDVENPAYDSLPKAIVAPHIDYARGWVNYANIYGRLRVADRPDRVIILGTNHFGQSTGVCGCNKGYESPLGVCNLDTDLVDALKANLGEDNAAKLFANRYDHENEHSIELHMPWIQHIFGADDAGNYPKIFGALIHDPIVNSGASYDGSGLDLDPFVEALDSTIANLPGKTLIISSADLSHVGPAFGDNQALAGEEEPAKAFRQKVATHDHEMLKLFTEQKIDDLIGSISWQQNPTRWCSIGNMAAAMRLTKPEKVELLNYAAAMDPNGTTFVSTAALAMF